MKFSGLIWMIWCARCSSCPTSSFGRSLLISSSPRQEMSAKNRLEEEQKDLKAQLKFRQESEWIWTGGRRSLGTKETANMGKT